MLTQAELKQLLSYDPATGIFTRLASKKRSDRIGKEAGTVNGNGYRNVKIGDKVYKAHRLAWLYVHGEWPENLIDHINGCLDDNRINNLRPATHKQNLENQKLHSGNTSGYRGVTWHATKQKWIARVTHHGKRFELGCYTVLEEAITMVRGARKLLFTHDHGRDAA